MVISNVRFICGNFTCEIIMVISHVKLFAVISHVRLYVVISHVRFICGNFTCEIIFGNLGGMGHFLYNKQNDICMLHAWKYEL